MNGTTEAQDITIRRLERKGFRVTKVSTFEEDPAPTVFLARRRGYTTSLCQVDPDGSCHGTYEWPAPIISNQPNLTS